MSSPSAVMAVRTTSGNGWPAVRCTCWMTRPAVDDARRAPGTAQYAVDEVPQIAAQQHVDQEDGVGHLVAVGAHGGADVGVGRIRIRLPRCRPTRARGSVARC